MRLEFSGLLFRVLAHKKPSECESDCWKCYYIIMIASQAKREHVRTGSAGTSCRVYDDVMKHGEFGLRGFKPRELKRRHPKIWLSSSRCQSGRYLDGSLSVAWLLTLFPEG